MCFVVFCHENQTSWDQEKKNTEAESELTEGKLLKKDGPNDKEAQENKTKGKVMTHRNVVELERDLRGVFDRKHSRGVTLCPSWVSSSTSAPADG